MRVGFGRLAALGATLVVLAAGPSARAADKPIFAPPAAWVQVAPIPAGHPGEAGPATEMLLDDNQSRLGPDGDELYNRRVIRIDKTGGLEGEVNRQIAWDPATDTVYIHWLRIIRDGKTIDLLGDGSKMLVIRRETNLERAMIDGWLTASEQIPGLQVGDIVDWSYTRVSRDPVMRGRSEAFDAIDHQGKAGRVRIRYLWPDAKPLRWRAAPEFKPVVTHKDGWNEMLIDLADVEAPKAPVGAPKRFLSPGDVEITEFRDWAEVSALMSPLYSHAATLNPDSPLKAEIERIRHEGRDAKARAALALQLVEDKTRYLYIGLNSGGLTPAPADETWTRRFGDCKGKTVLLLALLHGLGIEAQPILVSTTDGDVLGSVLPTIRFDHVMVRAMIDAQPYWLDGTRTGDDDLGELEPPDYTYGLLVQPAGGQLIHIDKRPLARPQIGGTVLLDARAGIDKPMAAEIHLAMTGDLGHATASGMARIAEADAKQRMKESLGRAYGWLTIQDVSWSWQDKAFVVVIKGEADLPWRENPDLGVRELKLPSSGGTNAGRAFPPREPGPNADAPYAAPYPMFVTGEVKVILPEGGRGFSIRGVNADRTIGPFHIVRSARLESGAARFVASVNTTTPEIPAAGVADVNRDMRRLAEAEEFVRAPLPAGHAATGGAHNDAAMAH